MAEYTIAEILDAMEKDGYPKAIGYYDDKKGAYCALGQAGLNLVGSAARVGLFLRASRFQKDSEIDGWDLWNYVADLNDGTDMSVADIAKAARKEFKDILDKKITIGGAS